MVCPMRFILVAVSAAVALAMAYGTLAHMQEESFSTPDYPEKVELSEHLNCRPTTFRGRKRNGGRSGVDGSGA